LKTSKRLCSAFASRFGNSRPGARPANPAGRSRWLAGLLLLPLVFGLPLFPPLPDQNVLRNVPEKLRDLLASGARFKQSDFRDLVAGRPVAELLPTPNGSDVAVAGAVRIVVPREFFLARFRDIVEFKKGSVVPAIGKFSTPPAAGDLDALQLELRDLEALRKCRVGHCGLKLAAADIQRFLTEISWSENDSAEAANQVFRQVLLARARSYLDTGDLGLADYDDKDEPVSIALEFRQLLSDMPSLEADAPRLADCLRLFPRCDARIEGFLYWSKEEYGHGLRPVVSITQVLIVRTESPGNGWIWEASKQLYASHYSDGSLGVSLLVEAPPIADAPSLYVIYFNRTRIDVLGGKLAFLIRGFLRDSARDEMKKRLARVKTRIESLYAAAPTSP
jgi:hypothetical protein